MSCKIEAHLKNAAGDFFVENGFCISCGAPEAEAPELMAHDDDHHCYFRRQPQTSEELERACLAVFVSCCGAVQYGGSDPQVLARLDELNAKCRRETRSWWKFWQWG
jgi:ferredoxin